jgi:molybdate transport system substrate-binding protein
MTGRLKRRIAAAMLLVVSASGCSAQSNPTTTTSITVFASSSMIKIMTAIGKQFEAENSGASVEFIFAGSADLAAQLADGNEADVFVSGNHDNMAAVANAGLVDGHPAPLASNSLVIVAAPGNRGNFATFADLARPGLRVALCGGTGACASATQQIEDHTGVRLRPETVDSTPHDVLNDVTAGRVDAGLVLKTDALSAGDNVSWFDFPEAADAVVTSWIALMRNSDRAELATKFINDVRAPAGRKVIADAGFADPVTSYVR